MLVVFLLLLESFQHKQNKRLSNIATELSFKLSLQSICMKRILQLVLAILVTPLILVVPTKAQTDSGILSNLASQNNGTQYFVDEAGLQLASSYPLDDFIDPETYQIGPFDVFSIQGNGLVQFTYRGITVNASGEILAPLVGLISLQGLSLEEAKSKITQEFELVVKETEVFATLDRPRRVNVHIGGNIPNPGRYLIPAGTRYDAIVNGFNISGQVIYPLLDQTLDVVTERSSQRPSFTGLNFDRIAAKNQAEENRQPSYFSRTNEEYDLRLVKVTKKNGAQHYVDLSGYFNSGISDFAPYLEDGDQITFLERSSRSEQVGISGAVNQPFSGTYRSDDTFEKLLLIAGGYQPAADSSTVVLIRINNDEIKRKEMSSVDVLNLQPGDQIIIPFSKSKIISGLATVDGQVDLPGTFSIQSGVTTLKDLIDISGGLLPDALPNASYLIRNSLDKRGVQSVSNINFSLLSRSSDQFIEGFDYMDLEQALNPNRMAVDLDSERVLNETLIQDGDRIIIPKDEQTISIMGQVNQPGFYNFDTNLSVPDYISLASGLTIAAQEDRIFVIKSGSRAWYKPEETSLQSGDIIFVDRTPFEDVSTGRNYEIQLQQLKNTRTQLIIGGISTIVGIITAYVAIRR